MIGLYMIITAWTVPGLPLWFSIVSTVLGSFNVLSWIIRAAREYR